MLDDLEGDDIVIESKYFSTNINDWNMVIRYLMKNYDKNILSTINESDFLNTERIEEDFFSSSPNHIMNGIIFDFNYFKLNLTFYLLNEIEFFTTSVVNLSFSEIKPFFKLIEELSNVLNKNAYFFIENSNQSSIEYNFIENKYKRTIAKFN